jgi:UDP-glucose:(glucosyl)LPS alpha-1,2-glucosyltransferase
MPGGIAWSEGSAGSSGGTELMARQLERRLPPQLLSQFQIHPSRYTSPDPTKIQVLWCHIRPEGPEMAHLADGGWQKFHFGIPWSRCAVILNAIEPIAVPVGRFDPIPPDRPIRLVYTPAPDRGLVILNAVFNEICRQRDDIELEVFSSFSLYGEGWAKVDEAFEGLFDALRQNPRVRYHGAVPNSELRAALTDAHVYAYPSISGETSCLSLIEAMSAGLACVHPNYGGLYETAADWTVMYQWQDNVNDHAVVLLRNLQAIIAAVRAGDPKLRSRLAAQKAYADEHYNWDARAGQWVAFLTDLAAAAARHR